MVHTMEQRPTDIDMVGPIDSRDEQALEDAGFVRAGRHWAFDWSEPGAPHLPSAPKVPTNRPARQLREDAPPAITFRNHLPRYKEHPGL